MTFHCVVGGSRVERTAAARALLARAANAIALALPASSWPFVRSMLPTLDPTVPVGVLIEDLHLAFPAGQAPGTRLVLTQSTYQLQRWLDRFDNSPHVHIAATGSKTALATVAPEAFTRRGPWGRIAIEERPGQDEEASPVRTDEEGLASVFSRPAVERFDILRRASLDAGDANPALHLALASTCMELDDLQPAQQALDRAAEIAPDWEAVWFEYGKLWLRGDDLERAAAQFAEAARLMPTFSAALGNLGAALAETDRPAEAIAALEQALRTDPQAYPILNNLAVIYREEGRLDEAIDAGRRVIALAPAFVFGYYNLAHALFLAGRFDESRAAYEEAHRRDPQKNPVQAARLAVVRAATGDGARAAAELRGVLERVPADVRERIVEETGATLAALGTLPHVPGDEIDRVRDVLAGK